MMDRWLGRLGTASIFVLLALGSPSPAIPQAEGPAQILGAIVMLFAASEECAIPIEPEKRSALAVAGGQIGVALGLDGDALDRLRSETAAEVKGGDCDTTRQRFNGVLDRTLLQVGPKR